MATRREKENPSEEMGLFVFLSTVGNQSLSEGICAPIKSTENGQMVELLGLRSSQENRNHTSSIEQRELM